MSENEYDFHFSEEEITRLKNEFAEKEKERQAKMDSIKKNDEYINWLVTLVKEKKSITDDGYDFDNDVDRQNIGKFDCLFKTIESYVLKTFSNFFQTDYGAEYLVKKDDFTIVVGCASGQGTYFYVQDYQYAIKDEPELKNIEPLIWENVVNDVIPEKAKYIKVQLDKMQEIAKDLLDKGCPMDSIIHNLSELEGKDNFFNRF
jgi:hypothetical protein